MYRVTVDTNVLVSALAYRRGKPFELLQCALRGEFNLTVSPPILEELADTLTQKFDANPREIVEATRVVLQAGRTVQPSCTA